MTSTARARGKAQKPIRIAISSCLLGERVRYDGNHKRDLYITQTLGEFFDFVPVCPEVAIGLGVPRPPIRLVGRAQAPRAVGVDDRTLDVTEKLNAYGERQARRLGDISGYIFKSKSPSCGLERVKVYGRAGAPGAPGRGVYAASFLAARPTLPAEEEGRLLDAALRENFIERVFAYRRWQELVAAGLTPASLIEFHARHKLALMAHDQARYQALGRLVAGVTRRSLAAIAPRYHAAFMETLERRATRRRHANVLTHLAGYLKRALGREDKRELQELISDYRLGRVPLIVPITLLKHYFRLHPNDYVARQSYLDPHPKELMLRNTI